jgi:hypothetical protein
MVGRSKEARNRPGNIAAHRHSHTLLHRDILDQRILDKSERTGTICRVLADKAGPTGFLKVATRTVAPQVASVHKCSDLKGSLFPQLRKPQCRTKPVDG